MLKVLGCEGQELVVLGGGVEPRSQRAGAYGNALYEGYGG
jgi:hypothetical protein